MLLNKEYYLQIIKAIDMNSLCKCLAKLNLYLLFGVYVIRQSQSQNRGHEQVG